MYYAGAFLQFVETTIVAAPSYFYIFEKKISFNLFIDNCLSCLKSNEKSYRNRYLVQKTVGPYINKVWCDGYAISVLQVKTKPVLNISREKNANVA